MIIQTRAPPSTSIQRRPQHKSRRRHRNPRRWCNNLRLFAPQASASTASRRKTRKGERYGLANLCTPFHDERGKTKEAHTAICEHDSEPASRNAHSSVQPRLKCTATRQKGTGKAASRRQSGPDNQSVRISTCVRTYAIFHDQVSAVCAPAR